MNFDILLQEVANAGIYAIMMVLGFVLFFFMYKFGVNRIEAMMKTSIEAIERSYKNANDTLNTYIEKYTKEHIKS